MSLAALGVSAVSVVAPHPRAPEGVAVPIFCNIHSRMSAFVVAVSTPHHTQAQADGSWTIHGVPPGRYVMHAWHERPPERTREVVVAGEAVTALDEQLDTRGWRPVSHKNKFGKEYPPTERDRY
jgi:hypothetical protein